MKLQDAVAVVTGASRGIGKATAIALAQEGAHVVCTARSTEDTPSKVPGTIDETARQIQALGRRALAVPCDIYRDDQVEALAQRTLAEFGRIDILVNNAAVNYFTPFLETTMKRWDVVLGVNLRGMIACTRAFLPRMIQQGGGRVINVSSGVVTSPWMAVHLGNLPYYTSKIGMEGLTQALAIEFQPHNIAVNCLRVDKTIASEGAFFWNPEMATSGQADRMAGATSGQVWEPPEVAAEAILWLATRPFSYSGHIVGIDEARWARDRGT